MFKKRYQVRVLRDGRAFYPPGNLIEKRFFLEATAERYCFNLRYQENLTNAVLSFTGETHEPAFEYTVTKIGKD